MTSKAAFMKAVDDFMQAARIEKQAAALRAAARTTILTYYQEQPEVFGPDPRGGEKTVVWHGIAITTPVRIGRPSRFDESRTEEFRRLIKDTYPGLLVKVFKYYPEFIPDKWMEEVRKHPERAGDYARLLLPFVLPATEDEPLSPRVSLLS